MGQRGIHYTKMEARYQDMDCTIYRWKRSKKVPSRSVPNMYRPAIYWYLEIWLKCINERWLPQKISIDKMVCSGGNKQSILEQSQGKKKKIHQGTDKKTPRRNWRSLMWNIHQHFWGGGVVKKVLSPRKKKIQTLFSSKSMYFALILLGI